ncbi:MAG: hypothetical protein DMG84_09570 [Acidobacteria bacterium]|nr:MAG: hypothetical protein DMG84_09570 [Acidobacteriota bacterium]
MHAFQHIVFAESSVRVALKNSASFFFHAAGTALVLAIRVCSSGVKFLRFVSGKVSADDGALLAPVFCCAGAGQMAAEHRMTAKQRFIQTPTC